MTMICAKAGRTSFSARNKRQFSFTTGFIDIAVIIVVPTGRAHCFTATCRRGLRVNTMENDPLASFMC